MKRCFTAVLRVAAENFRADGCAPNERRKGVSAKGHRPAKSMGGRNRKRCGGLMLCADDAGIGSWSLQKPVEN